MTIPDPNERLEAIRARAEAATPGPWWLWRGPEFVGGGEDICIGAGETWLANMDHRATFDPKEHGSLGTLTGWQQVTETDIATINPGEISREQEANAELIAHAREDVPYLLDLVVREREQSLALLEAALKRIKDDKAAFGRLWESERPDGALYMELLGYFSPNGDDLIDRLDDVIAATHVQVAP